LARAFEQGLCDAAYLDLSLINDPAGRKESNLWKLIMKARELEQEGGKSILNFLGEEPGSDLLDVTEGDATSAQEPNCINLMTIHGSKGLQFEHVIVPRMGESPRTSHTPPLDAQEGKFFFPIFDDRDSEGDHKSPFTPSPLDYVKVRDQRERERSRAAGHLLGEEALDGAAADAARRGFGRDSGLGQGAREYRRRRGRGSLRAPSYPEPP
jgi:hypothetical protein